MHQILSTIFHIYQTYNYSLLGHNEGVKFMGLILFIIYL